MNRNKVVEKFITARNGDFRVIDIKELVDALMECARKETLAELDRMAGIVMKEYGWFKEVQDG